MVTISWKLIIHSYIFIYSKRQINLTLPNGYLKVYPDTIGGVDFQDVQKGYVLQGYSIITSLNNVKLS